MTRKVVHDPGRVTGRQQTRTEKLQSGERYEGAKVPDIIQEEEEVEKPK